MCGIAGIFGNNWRLEQLAAMHAAQRHRGFDDAGFYCSARKNCGLAHNRLSIIDLSAAGRQPMTSADGNFRIVFNGEIYNYIELKQELKRDFRFQTSTDIEVLLAAYQKWGARALDRLIGMFAFVIWNEREQSAFAARDRFGVKPLYYQTKNDTLFLASEIKALHTAGAATEPDEEIWATFLAHGLVDHSEKTFWKNIEKLPAGHFFKWRDGAIKIEKWYDLPEKVGEAVDDRSQIVSAREYLALLKDAVRLRFRADVPIGINLSGGLDSATLLGLVHLLEKDQSAVAAYTFTTGDTRYDELPWVRRMLDKTGHPLIVSRLTASEVPALAADVQHFQDEPFGGLPTLAYARLFAAARENGTKVLLDGNGLDEQWAGYDYYGSTDKNQLNLVQGTGERPVRPECLNPEFRALAKTTIFPEVFNDRLRNLQYRDSFFSKIPRALRYNDRVSMRSSTELREPFLDHRLFELAFRQPPERKIANGVHKKMLREIVKEFLPVSVAFAPKRPLQTPQREWLRGELKGWATDLIFAALGGIGGEWFEKKVVLKEWARFCGGASDNSFYVWQWISVGLMADKLSTKSGAAEKKFESSGYQSSLLS